MKKINLTGALEAYRAAAKVTSDPYDEFWVKHFVKEENQATVKAFLEASTTIDKALDEVQQHCKVRCIEPWDICEVVEKIIEKFPITKKALAGCSFDVCVFAEETATKYKYPSMSTWFTLYFSGKAWLLTDIRRDYCNYSLCRSERSSTVHSKLTEEAKAAILANFEHF